MFTGRPGFRFDKVQPGTKPKPSALVRTSPLGDDLTTDCTGRPRGPICLFVNGALVKEIRDATFPDGGIMFGVMALTKVAGQGLVKDIEVCPLDGTKLTPEEAMGLLPGR